MNRRGLFPALAASLLLGVTAVVAQDLTDVDPKAIEARADTFKADAQALFDYATANAQTQAEEAQTVVAQGYEAAGGLASLIHEGAFAGYPAPAVPLAA